MNARARNRHASVLAAALGLACLGLVWTTGAQAAPGDIRTAVGGGSGGDGAAATQVALRHPRRVAFLPGGDLLVVEFGQAGGEPFYGDGRIRRVSGDGDVSTFAGTGVEGFSGDGGPATDATFSGPTDAIVTGDGAVLIADEFNHRIRRVAPDGTISTIAGSSTQACQAQSGLAASAEFAWPRSLALDPSGGYYVLDELCGLVHRVAPGPDHLTGTSDDTITTIAGTGATGFSGDGGPATSAKLNNPRGIAATSSSVLIADSLNRRIRRVSVPGGTITTVAGPGSSGNSGEFGPATSAYLSIPRDVEAVPDGGFLIADSGVHEIRRVLPDGDIVTIAGTGSAGTSGDGGPATSARLTEPFGANLSPDGDLYISGAGLLPAASTGQQRVRVVANALLNIPTEPAPPTPPSPPDPPVPPTPDPTPDPTPGGGVRPPSGVTTPGTPAAAPTAPAIAGALPAPPVSANAPVRLRLSVLNGVRGRAPRTALLRISANRSLAARRVVIQVGTRVRVHGRSVLRYRNATATVIHGVAAGVRLRLATRGAYRVRLSYRERGRARVSRPITLVAAPTASATAPVRLRLSVLNGVRGRAPRTALLRISANRSLAARRVVIQVGTRVRVHGRSVLRYRNATATVIHGVAAGVRLRLATRGAYRVRLSYRERGRARVSRPITLVAKRSR